MSGGLFYREGIDSTAVHVFAFHLLRNASWFSETLLLPIMNWRLPPSTWLLLAARHHWRHCQMLGLREVPSPRTSPPCDSQDQAQASQLSASVLPGGLGHPLLLLPPIPPNIRVFFNESALCIRWPKYWSFNFNISPSNEHPGPIENICL